MTEREIKDSIVQAAAEPKCPPELKEKGLAMARAFEKAVQEKNKAPAEKEALHTDTPFIGGSSLML